MSWFSMALTVRPDEEYELKMAWDPRSPASSPAYQWNSIVFAAPPAAMVLLVRSVRKASRIVVLPEPLSSRQAYH